MKKIILLFTVIAIVSCQQKAPADYALVSGVILNNSGNEFVISNNNNSINKTIEIAEDGSFTDTLRVDSGVYYFANGGQNGAIFLENGADILVNFDAADFENTLTFSGNGSEASTYLFEKRNIAQDIIGDRTAFYALDEADYLSKITEIKNAQEIILNAHKGISEDFKAKELRNINYEFLNKIDIYEMYHAHFAELPDFEVSENFEAPLERINFYSEEDFIFSNNYQYLVASYVREKAMELAKNNAIEEDIAYLKAVSEIESDIIRNQLLFEEAFYGITYTTNVEDYYAAYIASATNEENNAKITESYHKLKTLAKGEPSPKFVNYENFKGGTTSLDDLKGKYVYVDVWATWCGPCKAEIPALKELEAKYHGKNIDFVSISVDNVNGKRGSYESWKKMVEEEDLKGIQLFADKDWDSDFVKGYLIKGIPRFILIDPNGNIVQANAPAPSNEKLVELFNELKI
jgi:thiol-disulfide isomerase/thioredoxin